MTDKTFQQLESLVDTWALERSIYSQGTKTGQGHKTLEETTELLEAIFHDDPVAAKDAIGDILVTLIIQAHMWGFSLTSCLDHAYNEIKDRKGEMVGGVFIKHANS